MANAVGNLGFFIFLRLSRSLRRFLSRFSGDVKRLRFALIFCTLSPRRSVFFFNAKSFLNAFLLLFFFPTLAFTLEAAPVSAAPSIALRAFFFTRLRRTTGKNIHANFFLRGSFVSFGKAPGRGFCAARGAAVVPLIGREALL